MRRAVPAALQIVLAVCGAQALAQTPSNCHGPAEIERALTRQPSADAYNALGAWFAGRNQIPCAIPAFRSAIRLQPNASDGHFNRALALMEQRDFDHAINELRQAAKLNPSSAQVHTALGAALQEAGELVAAENELKTALERDPRSVTALDHLAQVLTAQKRHAAAIRYLQQAVA
ncbi:MAG: hypothetical protein DMG58_07285, partial [Acidobacteria bacterium]